MNKSTLWWVIIIIVLFIAVVTGIQMYRSNTTPVTPVADDQNPATTTPLVVASESRKTENVFAIAKSISGSGQFSDLLVNSGVGNSIGTTTYTIFVPTNIAFSKLPSGYLSSLNTSAKKSLVQYHIISGRSVDTDALSFGTIQTLSKAYLNFSVGTDKVPQVNSSNIVKQIIGKNGIVYIVDGVLLPPKAK